jgi:hypothetical protein
MFATTFSFGEAADLRSRSDESDQILNYGATKTRNVCAMIPFVENTATEVGWVPAGKMTIARIVLTSELFFYLSLRLAGRDLVQLRVF